MENQFDPENVDREYDGCVLTVDAVDYDRLLDLYRAALSEANRLTLTLFALGGL